MRVKHPVLVMLMLYLAALACWSSDTLFIPPTITPIPTTVPPTPSFESRYQIGQTVQIAGSGVAAVYLTQEPEPITRRNRVPNATCFPGSTVTISAVQEAEGVVYYQVSCNNALGWLAENNLTEPLG